jgi:hypothetical protein
MIALAISLSLVTAANPLLAAPGLTGTGIEKPKLSFFTDHLATQLAMKGVSVITASDYSAMLGVERQKKLVGCHDDSKCVGHILEDNVHADGMLVGTIDRAEASWAINLKVTTIDGRTVATFSRQVDKEEKVLDALEEAARGMAPEALKGLAPRDAGTAK